jgi:hypothetical protein
MKLCLRSFWFDDSVFSFIASCALAEASWPCRSMSLAFEVRRVHAREHLARLDGVALAHRDRAHFARYLGLDRRLADRLQRARHGQPA